MAGDDKSRGFDPEKRRRAMREQARTRAESRSDDDPLAHLKQEPKLPIWQAAVGSVCGGQLMCLDTLMTALQQAMANQNHALGKVLMSGCST